MKAAVSSLREAIPLRNRGEEEVGAAQGLDWDDRRVEQGGCTPRKAFSSVNSVEVSGICACELNLTVRLSAHDVNQNIEEKEP